MIHLSYQPTSSQTVSSNGLLYIHAFPFKLARELNLERLKQAWLRTTEYLDLLRTSFHFIPTRGSWIQAVHSICYPNWTETPIHMHESISADVENFIRCLDMSSETAFRLPPAYVRLYRDWSPSSSSVMVLILHHAIYDGLSIDKLNDVLKAFYHEGHLAPAPQFNGLMSYFKHQERHGTDFWTQHLKNYAKPQRINVSDGDYRSYSASCEIPVSATRLRDACRYFEVTAQCFGQASLAKLLAKLYHACDIVFGHVVSGRNVSQAEDVFGPLIVSLSFFTISLLLKTSLFLEHNTMSNKTLQKDE